MRKSGYTLVELMVALIVFAVVMTAMFTAWLALWNDQNIAGGMTTSQIGAKAAVFQLAEAFRAASICTSTDSGCVLNSGVQNASASACTIYSRDSNNNLVQTTYSISNGNLDVTTGSNTAILVNGGASMTLTYYTSTTYNATALTAFTPTASTEPDLIAVGISITVAQNGGNNSYSTIVRLNNGP